MKPRPLLSLASLLMAAALVLGAFTPIAEAAGGLKAQLFLVQAAVPRSGSEKALLAFGRSHNMRIMRESKDAPVKERKWYGSLIVAFNKPVGDLEFQVLFYDVHDGPRRFVNDMATFVDDRKQKTFVQKVTLSRPQFKPNRNMELVVTVRRAEVGRLKFALDGEEIRRSGRVDFSAPDE